METNRIEGMARDGIQTASQVARTAVQSGGETAAELLSTVAKLGLPLGLRAR